MKIIRTSVKDLDTNILMKYRMTQSKTSKAVSKMTDDELDALYRVVDFVEYEDVNQRGEVVTILSFLCDDDKVYAAQSSTFRESFNRIVDVVGDHRCFTIAIISNVSKAGRKFMDCDLRGID